MRGRVRIQQLSTSMSSRESVYEVFVLVRQELGPRRQRLNHTFTLPLSRGEQPSVVLHQVYAEGLESQELALARAGVQPGLGRRRRTAAPVLASKELEQALDAVLAHQMLREEVRRVLFTTDLEQLDRAISDPLLDPEALGVYVAETTQALALTDPQSGGAVGPHADGDLEPDV